jgi:drug/metabolite transporter (DMT)-like permease
MAANPPLGVFLHSVGGFASGSFYIPYKKVKNWAWEVYWLAGGVFSWIIASWLFAWAVARIGGARTAIYTSLTPVFAAVIAGVFLHESWSTLQWIGAAGVVVGVALAKLESSKR